MQNLADDDAKKGGRPEILQRDFKTYAALYEPLLS